MITTALDQLIREHGDHLGQTDPDLEIQVPLHGCLLLFGDQVHPGAEVDVVVMAQAQGLRHGPHLLVGLAMTGMIAVAASLSPLMQRGNVIARKAHVGLNMGMLTLFLWQAVSGMEIVNKIWTNR